MLTFGKGPPLIVCLAAWIAALVLTGPAAAAPRIADLGGHLAFGYARLFASGDPDGAGPRESRRTPAGSLSIAGGIDAPITSTLRYGVDVGYNLLGTRTEEQGSLVAELDYGVFEALGMLHWAPPRSGPLARVSVGAGVFAARADLSSSGGAAFADLAVEETVPGAALGLTLSSRGSSPVRVGLELGGRFLVLDDETWTVATARLAILY
jgi:hypothetical protein